MSENTFMDFEAFKKVFGVSVVSIGLECPTCRRIWGFKVTTEKDISQVKQGKLVCFYCVNKDKELE